MFRRLVLGLLAATVLPAVAHAGSKFQYLSQSVIVLEGIPSTRRKPADGQPQRVSAKPVRDDGSAGTMSADERRLLRYGLEEETERQIAEADRGALEEDTAEDTMIPVASEKPAKVDDESNVTITIEAEQPGRSARAWKSPKNETANPAALDRMTRLQEQGEVPEMPDRVRDPLPKYEKNDDGSLSNEARQAVESGDLAQARPE